MLLMPPAAQKTVNLDVRKTRRLADQRERREIRRAAERAQNQHLQLKARGKESRTSYGAALFQNYAELFSQGINLFLARKLVDPYSAGRHHSVWELLLHFCNRGPRGIAVVALTPVIDRISAINDKKKLGAVIGRALQDELNGTVIHDTKGTLLLGLVRKKFGRKTVSKELMRKLQVPPSSWTVVEKRELGCLLLDILISSTQLIKEVPQGKKLVIQPTPEVEELIRSEPPRALPIRRLPSLLPLEPWTDVVRNGKPLVSSRKPMDLSHITKHSCSVQMEVVNKLEGQTMQVNPWMVDVQRQAWDENLPLFPVRRDPDPKEFRSAEDASKRARIEESLRQAEEVVERPIWLEHDKDFRGRTYVSSRLVGHQGPDYSKGLLEFRNGESTDEKGFDHLLMAAAGHYGLSKKTWDERLAWGKENLHLISAVVQAPLDRLDLWKDASDPWQFLQTAREINQYLLNPARKLHTPVRFDQCCSGVGITACLTRDRELAYLTNIIWDHQSPVDLYSVVAEDLLLLLQKDLQGFDFRSARMAELWLKHPIDRQLTKHPCLTTIYGATHWGIVEFLTSFLMDRVPMVDLDSWDREYVWPAQYLSQKLNLVIAERMRSCIELQAWLKALSKACMKRQQRIRFHTPMGFPVSLGVEQEKRSKISTTINGTKSWQTADTVIIPGELSARATNRGIMANVIHAFDGSLCDAVVQRMHNVNAQVITNHDCFGSLPSNASLLHRLLHQELREHFKPCWLTEMHQEASFNAGIELPLAPIVGSLCEGNIGHNPYCYS